MRLLVLVVLLVGPSIAADSPKGDQERLQGTWFVVSVESQGKQESSGDKDFALLDEVRLVVERDAFFVKNGARVTTKGTIKLDPTKSPKEYDSTYADGRHLKGIYELDGDKFRLCLAAPGVDRPTAFTTKQGDHIFLTTYKRDTDKP